MDETIFRLGLSAVVAYYSMRAVLLFINYVTGQSKSNSDLMRDMFQEFTDTVRTANKLGSDTVAVMNMTAREIADQIDEARQMREEVKSARADLKGGLDRQVILHDAVVRNIDNILDIKTNINIIKTDIGVIKTDIQEIKNPPS